LAVNGELVTKPQARIEDAMAEIAAKYPDPPEISAIRKRASAVTKALKNMVTK